MSNGSHLAEGRAPKADRDARVDRLWYAYVAAYQQAQQSLDIEDGIRAGKLWAEWLSVFVGHRQ